MISPKVRPFSQRLNRRAIMGLLSGAAVAPWLPRLGQAQNATPQKRLVLCFQANGVIMDNWRPAGGTPEGAPLGEMSRSLAAFAPLRDKISVITGIDMPTPPGDSHLTGMGTLWTGCKMTPEEDLSKTAPENGALADGISIDYAVAAQTEFAARFNALKFHAGETTSNGLGPGWLTNSYSGPGQPVFGQSNPFALFDQIFEGFVGVDAGEAARLRSERQSVLDRITGDLNRLHPVMGSTDRRKVEQHLEHVRSIETRLTDDTELAAICDPATFVGGTADDFQALENDNFPSLVRLHTDLAVLALRCDLTRVLNMQWSVSVAGQTFNWFDYEPPTNTRGFRGHHEHSHDWDLNDVSRNYLSDIDRWYAEQVHYFVSQLDAMEEGDGTMLDNSLFVWGNEIARGNHTHVDMPFLVAGGASGALKMGRNYDLRGTGLLHNRLLVSIGRAMGLEIDTFGTMDNATGGLSQLEV